MNKYLALIMIFFCSLVLTGCLGSVWTGATLIYDRHNVYKKLNDYQLAAELQKRLFFDRVLKQPGCSLDLTVINGDVLLTGHVPTKGLKNLVDNRIANYQGYRHFYNFVSINTNANSSLNDAWLTAKIRAYIIADSEIDPHSFKIITADKIVYIMGDVRPQQAQRVIDIARSTEGVERVVKLMHYYNLSDKPILNS